MRDRRPHNLLLVAVAISISFALTSQNFALHSPVAESSQSLANFVELGYSPSTLSSLDQGTPVYSTGDSIWLLSNSSSIVGAQLISPRNGVVASKLLSAETVTRIYTFTTSDLQGTWSLSLGFKNSSTVSIPILFVNPSIDGAGVQLSNFSLQGGQLNLGFAMPSSDAYDLEGCLASADVNSTIAVPIPSNLGRGEMLLNGTIYNATVSVKGLTSEPFSFWYQMNYLYSYSGNATGELISRNVLAVSSSTAVFTSIAPKNVTLTNNTSIRPGRYQVNAYFDGGSGLVVEQTSALLLNNDRWLWLGQCNSVPISGPSFTAKSDLTSGHSNWPTVLYVMYEYNGVDSYTQLTLNLNITRVQLFTELGNESASYLSPSLERNPQVLASDYYNGALYVVGGEFPLSLQITPMFGQAELQTQTISISNPFTDNRLLVPVGALSIKSTLNSNPVSGANIVIQNKFGGETTAVSGLDGLSTVYIPAGQYNVTVSYEGQSLSKSVAIVTGGQSNLQFPFVQTTSVDYFGYLLVSTLIIGIMLNLWFWLVRPKQRSS